MWLSAAGLLLCSFLWCGLIDVFIGSGVAAVLFCYGWSVWFVCLFAGVAAKGEMKRVGMESAGVAAKDGYKDIIPHTKPHKHSLEEN